MKYLIPFFILTFLGCTLHHYSMDREPIRIYDSPGWKERKKLSLTREIIPAKQGKPESEISKSYNSEGLSKYIMNSCCLEVSEQSSINVKYSTNVKDELNYPLTVFLWFFTLGIVPVFEEVDSEIKILVQDQNGASREYNYKIKEHAYNSWLTIPISILMIPNDSYSHSFIHLFDYPQKFIANRFEKDFLEDITTGVFSKNQNQSKIPVKNKTISSKSKIAILPVKFQYANDSSIAEAIRDKVETVLVNKKLTVIERVKLNEIIKELKLSQSGLTTADQTKVGNMLNATNLILGEILEINQNDNSVEFSLRNIDLETGKILWKYEFSLDKSNITNSLNQSMREFESKIQVEN